MTLRVLIAGGGTGGHLFPGVALAQEFMTRHTENDVRFVGTARGIEREAVPRAGFPLELIEVRGLKGQGLAQTLKNLLLLPRSLLQSLAIVRRYRPGVCVSVGGYAAGPVALACWLARVPVVVLEQNALPGLTNRILGRLAKQIFTSFERAHAHFPRGRAVLTGNPIRQAMMENFLRPARLQPKARDSVLVFGGSQGARALSDRVIEAMALLQARGKAPALVHQTGKTDVARVEAAYAERGLSELVEVTPFIHDMAEAYARASLVVCRAGATTLAELAICKKASILVPFPYASDNHQEVNAQAMAEQGAALMMVERELSPEALADAIAGLLDDPQRRHAMEQAAGALGTPEAAREIADACVDLWIQTGGFAREQKALARARDRGEER